MDLVKMKEITEKTRLEKLFRLTPRERLFETNNIEDLTKLQLTTPLGSTAIVQYLDNPLIKVTREKARFVYLNRCIEIEDGYSIEIYEKNHLVDAIISKKLAEKVFHPDSQQTVLNKPYFRIEHIVEIPFIRLVGDIYTGKPPGSKKEKYSEILTNDDLVTI